MKSEVCYLCGEIGATTRDHLPPKAFLGRGNYNQTPRITLPAHIKCNLEFSEDEEYVRDLMAPSAGFFDLRGVEPILEKAQRSRTRPAGSKRFVNLLRASRPIQLRSPSGLYLGRARGILYDRDRVRRIGVKIARGILYHDAKAIIRQDEVICSEIPIFDVNREKSLQLAKGNPYWQALGSEACIHTMFGESVAVRRIYIGTPTTPQVTIICYMGIMLLTSYFVIFSSFPLSDDIHSSFRFCVSEAYGWEKKGTE